MVSMKPVDRVSCDGPFQRPMRPLSSSSTMDQFDRLVLKAAKKKRKDIINRYGDEGCSRLMARKSKQDQQQLIQQTTTKTEKDDELLSVKSDYEKTIRDLKEAQKELNSSCHSHRSKENQSPKKERRRRPVHVETKNDVAAAADDDGDDDDDDELDIDKLFELAWGSDISSASTLATSASTLTTSASILTTSTTATTKNRAPPPPPPPREQKPNNNSSDEAFAKKLREGTVRKLLKVRETKTPKVRRVPSKDKHPGSLAWQWNLEGYVPKQKSKADGRWQWNLA